MTRRSDLDPALERVGRAIVDAAIAVHRELGPGFLESVYEEALVFELRSRGHRVERQVHIPVQYRGHHLDSRFRLDLLVDGQVIVEVKAVETLLPVHEAQILSYLRAGNIQLGFLLNFNVPLMREGIRRRVNTRAGPT